MKESAHAALSYIRANAEKLGVEKDFYKAFELYKKSAMGGDAKAQFNLGRYYYSGKGVERNFKEELSITISSLE